MVNEVIINFDGLKFPQEKLGFVTLALLAKDNDVEISSNGCTTTIKKYENDNILHIEGELSDSMFEHFQKYVYGKHDYCRLTHLEPVSDSFIRLFHSKFLRDVQSGHKTTYGFKASLAVLLGNANSSVVSKYLLNSPNRKTGFVRKLLFSLALASTIWFVSSKTKHLVIFVPNITDPNPYMRFLKYGRSTSYRNVCLSTPNEALLQSVLDISIKKILFDNIGFSGGHFAVISIQDRVPVHVNIINFVKNTDKLDCRSINALYLYNTYRFVQNGSIYGSSFFDEPNTLHAAFDIILDNVTKMFLGKETKFYSNISNFKEFHARTLLASTEKESAKVDILFPKLNTLAQFVNQVLNNTRGGKIMTDKERFVFETLIQAFKFHLLERSTRHGGGLDDLQGYVRGVWARLKSYRQDKTNLLNFLSDFLLDYVQMAKLNDGGYSFKQCCEFIYDNPNDTTDIALISLLTACSEIQRKTKNTEEEN